MRPKETAYSRQANDTLKSVVTYDYGSGTSYALGAAVSVATTDSKLASGAYLTGGYTTLSTSTTANSFAWYDGAVQSSVAYTKSGTTFTSTYSYSGGGSLVSASVNDGRARTVAFTTDMQGQVIRRDEAGGNSAGDPHEVWYRYNGRQLGYTGNNGTLDTDYTNSGDTIFIHPGPVMPAHCALAPLQARRKRVRNAPAAQRTLPNGRHDRLAPDPQLDPPELRNV